MMTPEFGFGSGTHDALASGCGITTKPKTSSAKAAAGSEHNHEIACLRHAGN
jgi:hypothetical protein